MDYSSRHVSQLFNISHETVRAWSIEFTRHLSDMSNPGKGRHRQFNQDDLEKLALVAELKQRRLLYEDIHAALDSGQRGEIPQSAGMILGSTEHRSRLALLQQHAQDLEQRLQVSQLTEAETRGENRLLKEQLTQKESQIKDLYKEIGRLEANQDDKI